MEEVKRVLRLRLLDEDVSLFNEADIQNLASNGFLTVSTFEATDKDILRDVLPGRAALVGVLLKAFASPAAPQRVPRAAVELWKVIRELQPQQYEAGKIIKLDHLEQLKSYHFHQNGSLFIRESFATTYNDIIACFDNGSTLVRLCGIPGVGKSMYIWYFVMRLVHDARFKDWDIVLDSLGYFFVFKPNGEVLLYSDSTDYVLHKILDCKHCIQLINQKYTAPRPLGHRIVIFTSPDTGNYKDATKEGMVQDTVYIDGWPYTEFRKLGLARGKSVDEINEVWKLTEGVPRVLFEIQLDAAKTWLRGGLSRTDFTAVKECIGRDKNSPNVSFCLMKYVIIKGTRSRSVEVDFASKTVGYIYFEELMQREKAKLVQFLKASAGLTDRAAMRGFLFEQYALSWLTGRPVKIQRKILERTGGSSELRLVNRELKVYVDINEVLVAGKEANNYIWRSHNPNNAGFDALAPPYQMFEFTIASQVHNINHDGFVKGAKALEQLQMDLGIQSREIQYTWFGPEGTDNFPRQKFVKKKREARILDPICSRMSQYHCVIKLSEPGEEVESSQIEVLDLDDEPVSLPDKDQPDLTFSEEDDEAEQMDIEKEWMDTAKETLDCEVQSYYLEQVNKRRRSIT